MTGTGPIEAAFRAACEAELQAPKPGNVHVHAPGHGMTVDDFRRSADAAAPALCRSGARLGARVLDAVTATGAAVGQNTNLGILLLCAPLAMAAARAPHDLRQAVARVLAEADLADADAVFRAIALANPGGLGQAEHDVRAPARVTLAVAMAQAQRHDRIALQYVSGFADIFDGGLSTARAAQARWADPAWCALAVFLHFLASFPDSHIQRKHGAAVADHTRAAAARMNTRLFETDDADSLLPDLLLWDSQLKTNMVNPGTSADLTVATLFAESLAPRLRKAAGHG